MGGAAPDRPVFLLEPTHLASVLTGDRVAVVGSEGRHGRKALRLGEGSSVDLVDGRGRRVCGMVVAVGPESFDVLAQDVLDEARRSPNVTVVQALAKGSRAESAVEMLTEAGADRIVPWQAERSVVRWVSDRAARGQRRWEAVCAAATKQSRRAWRPVVEPLADRTAVCDLIRQAELALVLDPSGVARLAHVAVPRTGSVLLVVGPEGGLTREELADLRAAGALVVRMGTSVMRTSTAGVAAMSVVMSGSGRWD